MNSYRLSEDLMRAHYLLLCLDQCPANHGKGTAVVCVIETSAQLTQSLEKNVLETNLKPKSVPIEKTQLVVGEHLKMVTLKACLLLLSQIKALM